MQVVIISCSVKTFFRSFYLELLKCLCFEKSSSLFHVKGLLFLDVESKEKVWNRRLPALLKNMLPERILAILSKQESRIIHVFSLFSAGL